MDSDHSVFTVPVTPQYVASVLHAEKHKVGFHPHIHTSTH